MLNFNFEKNISYRGCDKMFTLGAVIFLLSGLIVFGSDRLYRKKKITSLKSLLIVKSSGLLGSVIGALVMFYGKQ